MAYIAAGRPAISVDYPNKQTKQVLAQYALNISKSLELSSYLPDSWM